MSKSDYSPLPASAKTVVEDDLSSPTEGLFISSVVMGVVGTNDQAARCARCLAPFLAMIVIIFLIVLLAGSRDEYLEYQLVITPNYTSDNVTRNGTYMDTSDPILTSAALAVSASSSSTASYSNDETGLAVASETIGVNRSGIEAAYASVDNSNSAMFDPVIDSGVQSYIELPSKRLVFNWTLENLDVAEASTQLLADAPLGQAVPGRVTKGGVPLVEAFPGNSPFLLFCPDARYRSVVWKEYMANWIPGTLTCLGASEGEENCPDDSLAEVWQQEIAPDMWSTFPNKVIHHILKQEGQLDVTLWGGDPALGSFCEDLYQYIVNQTNGEVYPHMLKVHVPPIFMDLERASRTTLYSRGRMKHLHGITTQNPELEAVYDDAMGFLREMKNIVAASYGFGWHLFLRSHIGAELQRCDFGTGYLAELEKIYFNSSITFEDLEGDTAGDQAAAAERESYFLLQDSSRRRQLTPHQSLFSSASLSEILSRRGLGAAPSLAHQYAYPIQVDDDDLGVDGDAYSSDQNGAGQGATVARETCVYCKGTPLAQKYGMQNLLDAKARLRQFDEHETKNRPIQSWFVGYPNTVSASIHGSMIRDAESRSKTVEVWGESLLDHAALHWGLKYSDREEGAYPSLAKTFAAVSGGKSCLETAFLKQIRPATRQDYLTLNECIEACNDIGEDCKFIEMNVGPGRRRYCNLMPACTLQDERYTNVVSMANL